MMDFLVYRVVPAFLLLAVLLLLLPQTSASVVRLVADWVYGF